MRAAELHGTSQQGAGAGDVIGHDLVRLTKRQHTPEKIHRATCYAVQGKDVVPWIWAEGRPVSEWTGLAWMRPCSICRPDSNVHR